MNVIKNKNFGTHNTTRRTGSIQYIVIHYTATNNASGANQVAYFNHRTTRNASADFFVDFNGDVYQYNPDIKTRYTWAVGGRKLHTAGGSMYGRIKNANSVSIEMCCKQQGGIWTITDATYNATIELARSLKAYLGLPNGRIYRHYDVTGKLCPNIYGFISPDNRWQAMRASIDGSAAPAQPVAPSTPASHASSGSSVAINKSAGSACDMKVEVIVSDLVIRTAPNGEKTGKVTGKGIFTISRYSDGWGLLKSGAGWIYINNPQYVKKSGGSAPAPAKKYNFRLAVDGSLGVASVQALQTWLGTTVDGVVSGQPMSNKRYLSACPSNWKFTSHGATGSMMIKRLQSKVGVASDGFCGPGTVKALQRMVGVAQDGYLGPNTAKALQRYLNNL